MFEFFSGYRRWITMGIVFAVFGVALLFSPQTAAKTSKTDLLLGAGTLVGFGALCVVIGVLLGRRRRSRRDR